MRPCQPRTTTRPVQIPNLTGRDLAPNLSRSEEAVGSELVASSADRIRRVARRTATRHQQSTGGPLPGNAGRFTDSRSGRHVRAAQRHNGQVPSRRLLSTWSTSSWGPRQQHLLDCLARQVRGCPKARLRGRRRIVYIAHSTEPSLPTPPTRRRLDGRRNHLAHRAGHGLCPLSWRGRLKAMPLL